MRNQIEKQLQVISEKLGDIAENISEVYKSGINSGGLKKISLIDLYAEGKIVPLGDLKFSGVTENSILPYDGDVAAHILLTGYLEFSLHLEGHFLVEIDGRIYAEPPGVIEGPPEDTVHFAGKVSEYIGIYNMSAKDVTFESFVKGRKVLEDVFNSGELSGEDIGANEQWNVLWDDIQDFGNRVLYNNGFQNAWSDVAFQPKYDMRPTSAGYMFAGTRIADLKGCLEKGGVDGKGVTLDLSKATSIDRIFSDAPNITHISEISTVSAPHLQNFVYNCKNLISIDKIVLKDDGSQTFNDNSFKNCNELTEIRISGTIGSTINFQWSKKLSMMSLSSIVSALSTSVTGQTITFPTTARETYDNATVGGRWDDLVAEHPNWTFKYA